MGDVRAERRRRARGPRLADGLPRRAALGRAQLRLRLRLHQHVVDAAGGPQLRLRLPPARATWRAAATTSVVPRPDAVGRGGPVPGLHVGLRRAGAGDAAAAGPARAVAQPPELPPRRVSMRVAPLHDGVLAFSRLPARLPASTRAEPVAPAQDGPAGHRQPSVQRRHGRRALEAGVLDDADEVAERVQRRSPPAGRRRRCAAPRPASRPSPTRRSKASSALSTRQ